MNRFFMWVALIAATAYLFLLGFSYTTHPKRISDFTQTNLWHAFGALFAVFFITRWATSRLRDSRRQAEDSKYLPLDSDELHPIYDQAVKSRLSFGEAMRKKRGILAVLFLFALLLPPLIQLGKRPGVGAVPFTRAYWQFVIIGELLMAVCVTIGWFVAKRKYERSANP
jgi:hypothetical protein